MSDQLTFGLGTFHRRTIRQPLYRKDERPNGHLADRTVIRSNEYLAFFISCFETRRETIRLVIFFCRNPLALCFKLQESVVFGRHCVVFFNIFDMRNLNG